MSETLEQGMEERLAALADKLTRLEEVSWLALVAMESMDADAIAKAKRRLGAVLADL